MHKKVYLILILFAFLKSENCFSQDRITTLDSTLKQLSLREAGLNDTVELSVNGATMQEFLDGIASANNLNITVDPDINQKVYNNFSHVTVVEVLLFLCKKFNLDISFTGSIMTFFEYKAPQAPVPKYVRHIPTIIKDSATNTLTIDLKNDSLALVMKFATQLTGANIAYPQDLSGKLLNGYFQNISLSDALDKLAFSNDFKVLKNDNNSYLLARNEQTSGSNNSSTKNTKTKGAFSDSNDGILKVNLIGQDRINIQAGNISLSSVIEKISETLKTNYFLYDELKGNITLNISNASFDDFLDYIFSGTDYTYKKNGLIYLIGLRNSEELRVTKVLQLKFRSVDKIMDVIPTTLTKDVTMKPFPDLNSIIVSGSLPNIEQIQNFLMQIDKVVPMVIMQIIIIDIQNSKSVSTGISAGLGTTPVPSSGTILPGANVTLSSSAVNDLISGINGLGLVNLGKLTPNFYVTLKALEQRGLLQTKSTPQLATLNGHEANMTIGQTQYYLEQANNVIGSQNPQNIITQQYKPINADLSITITPMVSGDNQITLDISVKQSDFTARISAEAPPGTTSRDFKSLVRMRNEETVLLGGLEENSKNNSTSGLPLLARIPIIKWIFGNNDNSTTKSKLLIFLKPTVIY